VSKKKRMTKLESKQQSERMQKPPSSNQSVTELHRQQSTKTQRQTQAAQGQPTAHLARYPK